MACVPRPTLSRCPYTAKIKNSTEPNPKQATISPGMQCVCACSASRLLCCNRHSEIAAGIAAATPSRTVWPCLLHFRLWRPLQRAAPQCTLLTAMHTGTLRWPKWPSSSVSCAFTSIRYPWLMRPVSPYCVQ